MNIEIQYKHIKHGYVRVTKNQGLKLSIPRWKRFDAQFKNILIEKGKKLLKKQKDKKQKIKIPTFDDTFVWIRGKKISRHQIPSCDKKNDQTDKKMNLYLKKICYEQAIKYADIYSKKIGYTYNILKIKKIKSKRGSCSIRQNININLSLVHVEKQYLEYVIAHEVCHLQHKHHQKSFRELVEKIYPKYKQVRKGLKHIYI